MMTLPEAIRLGSMLGPQAFGTEATPVFEKPHLVATCAIGAAKAAGMELEALYAAIGVPAHVCPVEGCGFRSYHRWLLRDLIFHLNDNHHMTREAIADIVEQLEAASTVRTVLAAEEILVLAE